MPRVTNLVKQHFRLFHDFEMFHENTRLAGSNIHRKSDNKSRLRSFGHVDACLSFL
ncbi:unnamed protein product [Boreogadus saida]